MVHEWGESFKVYGPFETMLDDVSFGNYHMFRGEAKILTGFDPGTGGAQGGAETGGMPSGAPKSKP
jgi:hypothetical protein